VRSCRRLPALRWALLNPGGVSPLLLGALVLSAGLGGSGQALAASPMELVEWEAPEACAGALEVYEQLRRTLGDVPDGLNKLSRVRGTVVPTSGGYRLALDVLERGRRSSRVLEAEQCGDLVDAAVLAITLALTVDGSARARAALTLEPAPEPPTSTPGTIALTPNDASPDATQGSAPPPLGGFLSVGALVEIGALPHPTAGVEVTGALRRGPLALVAHGSFLATNRLDVRPREHVELGLWLAGLSGCYAGIQAPLRIEACGGMEVGRYHALGLDLRAARRVEDTWLAPGAALGAAIPLSGAISLVSGVGIAFPLMRHRYTVNGGDDVHAPGRASLRFHLALALTSSPEPAAL
jgi:hypothetical protein